MFMGWWGWGVSHVYGMVGVNLVKEKYNETTTTKNEFSYIINTPLIIKALYLS